MIAHQEMTGQDLTAIAAEEAAIAQETSALASAIAMEGSISAAIAVRLAREEALVLSAQQAIAHYEATHTNVIGLDYTIALMESHLAAVLSGIASLEATAPTAPAVAQLLGLIGGQEGHDAGLDPGSSASLGGTAGLAATTSGRTGVGVGVSIRH